MSEAVNFIEGFNSFFTDNILSVLLLFTGIFLTIKTGFIQIRCFKQGLKNTFGGMFSKEKSGGISAFQALMTSLAAQLGTGNIVGAGAAVITGGPGAVFWMWVSAFFGMATAYEEAYFAQKTRKKAPSGEATGGAAYYIEYAFKGKGGRILSRIFSLFSVMSLGFTGISVQSNSISESLKEALNIPLVITGAILTLLAASVLFKGTKTVARLSSAAVPLLALLYTLGCFSVIIINIKNVPSAFLSIFTCAFSKNALFGGLTGISVKTALTVGIKRGLFTNEAGMGSTPQAHALAENVTPHFQGTLGMTGVVIDTFFMLTLTAVSVICVLYTGDAPPSSALSGSEAVSLAFSSVFGQRGAALFIAVSVFFFAFASILGWNIFGKSSCIFLFGEKCVRLYTVSSLLFVFFGCVFPGKLVWALTDLFNTCCVLTNIPALIKLSKNIESVKSE